MSDWERELEKYFRSNEPLSIEDLGVSLMCCQTVPAAEQEMFLLIDFFSYILK